MRRHAAAVRQIASTLTETAKAGETVTHTIRNIMYVSKLQVLTHHGRIRALMQEVMQHAAETGILPIADVIKVLAQADTKRNQAEEIFAFQSIRDSAVGQVHARAFQTAGTEAADRIIALPEPASTAKGKATGYVQILLQTEIAAALQRLAVARILTV